MTTERKKLEQLYGAVDNWIQCKKQTGLSSIQPQRIADHALRMAHVKCKPDPSPAQKETLL